MWIVRLKLFENLISLIIIEQQVYIFILGGGGGAGKRGKKVATKCRVPFQQPNVVPQ